MSRRTVYTEGRSEGQSGLRLFFQELPRLRMIRVEVESQPPLLLGFAVFSLNQIKPSQVEMNFCVKSRLAGISKERLMKCPLRLFLLPQPQVGRA